MADVESKKPELWLVHDKGIEISGLNKPIKDQYRAFNTAKEALEHGASVGFLNVFGINTKVGVANVYQCGDVDVLITRLR